jgi:restriction system protein
MSQAQTRQHEEYRASWEKWSCNRDAFLREQQDRNRWLDAIRQGCHDCNRSDVIEYFRMVLEDSEYPDGVPREHDCDYRPESKILVIDHRLPPFECIPTVKAVRYVQSRDELVESYLTKKARQQMHGNVIYAVALRTLDEVFAADSFGALESVVFNGFIRQVDARTGQCLTTCIISVQAGRNEFSQFNLRHVDPSDCFRRLRGLGGVATHSLAPVAPILQINCEVGD